MQNQFSYRNVAALAVAILLVIAGAHAGQSRSRTRTRNNGFSTTTRGPVRQCDDLQVSFDDRRVAQSEQTLAIPRSSAPVLRAHMAASYGISAFTGSGPDYSVLVCKYAAATYDSSSSDRLDTLRVTAQNGEITANSFD